MSNAWIGVVGALGGVVVTSLIGVVTAILNHRWTTEGSREQRRFDLALKRAESRRLAYARLLSAVDNLRDAVEAAEAPADPGGDRTRLAVWYGTERELVRELQTADNEAKIVASEPVFTALNAYGDVMSEYLGKVFDDPDNADDEPGWNSCVALMAAMRAEQESDLHP